MFFCAVNLMKLKKLTEFRRFFCRDSLFYCNRWKGLNHSIAGRVFTRNLMELSKVVAEFEKTAPLSLAESWDNVGLLVEPLHPKLISAVLLTNDLTEAVLEEALLTSAEMIFSYHPPIFSPIKSLRRNKWKDRIIMSCIERNIAVYSPHTASDSVHGGVNDWLISCFELSSVGPIKQSMDALNQYTHIIDCCLPLSYNVDVFKTIPMVLVNVISKTDEKLFVKLKVKESSLIEVMTLFSQEPKVECISLSKCESYPLLNFGMGRVGELKEPIKIQQAVQYVKQHLNLNHVRISFGKQHTLDSTVKSVAVCAGSGASVLRGTAADLYITGELSHHELLDACHQGITVILCEHSNSERGYLKKLSADLEQKLNGVQMIIAKSDKDPVCII